MKQKFFFTLVLSAIVLLNNLLIGQCNWQSLGPNDFHQASYGEANGTDIAIDGSGVPYVVYND
ncbi:MAG: hypothetical protein IPG08_16965, partial [Sphingobacteriaceae bacterium]|nr:hypothetical protein [Sphingobacteriaceae bacterium]